MHRWRIFISDNTLKIILKYTKFYTFAVIDVKSPYFWDMAPYHWVMDARHFGTTQWYYFRESKCPRKFGLTSSPLIFMEGTGTNNPVTRRHVSEERRYRYKTTFTLKTVYKKKPELQCTKLHSCNCNCLGTALNLDYIKQTGVKIAPYVALYFRYTQVP